MEKGTPSMDRSDNHTREIPFLRVWACLGESDPCTQVASPGVVVGDHNQMGERRQGGCAAVRCFKSRSLLVIRHSRTMNQQGLAAIIIPLARDRYEHICFPFGK